MNVSLYHQKYAAQSDEEVARKVWEKEQELTAIFGQVPFLARREVVKLAVLGCGDKRLVKAHKLLFERFTRKTVIQTTFDITIEHLEGEEGVVAHDCTLPLPDGPYDITYGHVLLKFIPGNKQWEVLKNSYDALSEGGVAIHILNREEIEEEVLDDGLFVVPLEELKERLMKEEILYKEIRVTHGVGLVLSRS